MGACSANGCNFRNSRKNKEQKEYEERTGEKIRFYRFPVNNELQKKWLQAMRREDLVPTRISRMCSQHFTSSSFQRSDRSTRLLPGSVPTIFPAFPLYLQKKNTVGVKLCHKPASSCNEPITAVPLLDSSSAQHSPDKKGLKKMNSMNASLQKTDYQRDTPVLSSSVPVAAEEPVAPVPLVADNKVLKKIVAVYVSLPDKKTVKGLSLQRETLVSPSAASSALKAAESISKPYKKMISAIPIVHVPLVGAENKKSICSAFPLHLKEENTDGGQLRHIQTVASSFAVSASLPLPALVPISPVAKPSAQSSPDENELKKIIADLKQQNRKRLRHLQQKLRRKEKKLTKLTASIKELNKKNVLLERCRKKAEERVAKIWRRRYSDHSYSKSQACSCEKYQSGYSTVILC